MDCETLVTYLSDYIDGNLSEPLEEAAREHLATCQNCRVVLDSTQKTILLYREQGHQVIPAERRQALFDHLTVIFSAKPKNDM